MSDLAHYNPRARTPEPSGRCFCGENVILLWKTYCVCGRIYNQLGEIVDYQEKPTPLTV